MTMYKSDGGVISSSVPRSQIIDREHNKLFGIYKGQIVRVIYPKDPDNSNGGRTEYVVRVNGQDYPNAVSIKKNGGIYQTQETIYKPIERSETGQVNTGEYPENLDGEMIYVMFIEGHGNVPVIIGCADHPLSEDISQKEEGRFDYQNFNGVEILIDKESNYVVKQAGRKSPDGDIENEDAVGSYIKMFGNGDIELNTHGTETTEDLRIKMTKADKKMEFYAQDNKVVYDSVGVSILDKNNNEFKFTSSGVEIKSANMAKFEGDAGTDVGSDLSATNVKGLTVALAGGGLPVARISDQVIGVGNLGGPVVSTIVTGSAKVTSS